MAISIIHLVSLLQLIASTLAAPTTPAAPTTLNLTAISAADGASTLECWQLADPFTVSSQAGTSGVALHRLGDTVNTSVLVIPAHFDGGAHRAPAVQYVSRRAPYLADQIGFSSLTLLFSDTFPSCRERHTSRFPPPIKPL